MIFDSLRKLFGYGPETPPEPVTDIVEIKSNYDYPPREIYTKIPFHDEAKPLPIEEFLLDTHPVPQANSAGNYYDNLRAAIAAEEAFHTKLINDSVAFITHLNEFNLRKHNRPTAELDEEMAIRAFGDKDYGGYAGTINQAKLEKAVTRFEAGDVNLKDDSDNE